MKLSIMNVRGARQFWVAALAAGLLAGCAAIPQPLSPVELATEAEIDRELMFSDVPPLTGSLTLGEAIARVLAHNLDRRAKIMEEALALGQLELDRFDLLPKLVTNAGYNGRSEFYATTSTDLITGLPSDANPTYSSDRDLFTADLGLTWNVLDFGVSYYNAQQNADRALIAAERHRRAVANLIQEVRFAYWRAAAAQVLRDKVRSAIRLAERALRDAEQVEREGLRDPVEALRFQKALLENLRQLEAIEQELAAARAELAALINVPPGTEIRLAVSSGSKLALPGWPLDSAQMEELAFVNNPDLREHIYHSRIAADETRKAVLRMLPGISVSLSREFDSNSFLYQNRWNGAGAMIAWNLLNVLSGPYRISQAETAEAVAEARRLALRMAVLAQVHVANHQFRAATKQYRRAERLWRVESRLAAASARQQENNAESMMARVGAETAAIAAELRRYQTYAQLQAAFGRMQASIGVTPVPDEVMSRELPVMAEAIDTRLTELASGEALKDELKLTETAKLASAVKAETGTAEGPLGWLFSANEPEAPMAVGRGAPAGLKTDDVAQAVPM